jgi:hypothetical protein
VRPLSDRRICFESGLFPDTHHTEAKISIVVNITSQGTMVRVGVRVGVRVVETSKASFLARAFQHDATHSVRTHELLGDTAHLLCGKPALGPNGPESGFGWRGTRDGVHFWSWRRAFPRRAHAFVASRFRLEVPHVGALAHRMALGELNDGGQDPVDEPLSRDKPPLTAVAWFVELFIRALEGGRFEAIHLYGREFEASN